jgi:hypothetical protein
VTELDVNCPRCGFRVAVVSFDPGEVSADKALEAAASFVLLWECAECKRGRQ